MKSAEDMPQSLWGVEVILQTIPGGLERAKLRGIFNKIPVSGFCLGGTTGGKGVVETPQASKSYGCISHTGEREVKRSAVVRPGQDIAQCCGTVTKLGEIVERVHIPETLAHLRSVHEEVGNVEPEACERAATATAALSDFVFMVGEDEIHPAGVQVEGIAEVLVTHGGAL